MNEQELWKILDEVMDPEIPVLSLVDLGVIREASIQDGNPLVVITPTYSGCPAMKVMEDQWASSSKPSNGGRNARCASPTKKTAANIKRWGSQF